MLGPMSSEEEEYFRGVIRSIRSASQFTNMYWEMAVRDESLNKGRSVEENGWRNIEKVKLVILSDWLI